MSAAGWAIDFAATADSLKWKMTKFAQCSLLLSNMAWARYNHNNWMTVSSFFKFADINHNFKYTEAKANRLGFSSNYKGNHLHWVSDNLSYVVSGQLVQHCNKKLNNCKTDNGFLYNNIRNSNTATPFASLLHFGQIVSAHIINICAQHDCNCALHFCRVQLLSSYNCW